MNWSTFLCYTGICYATYYLFMLAMDSRRSVKNSGQPETTILTFSEDHPPEKVILEDLKPGLQPGELNNDAASVGLGGVSMQGLYELAQTEALQYTRSVSF